MSAVFLPAGGASVLIVALARVALAGIEVSADLGASFSFSLLGWSGARVSCVDAGSSTNSNSRGVEVGDPNVGETMEVVEEDVVTL